MNNSDKMMSWIMAFETDFGCSPERIRIPKNLYCELAADSVKSQRLSRYERDPIASLNEKDLPKCLSFWTAHGNVVLEKGG